MEKQDIETPNMEGQDTEKSDVEKQDAEKSKTAGKVIVFSFLALLVALIISVYYFKEEESYDSAGSYASYEFSDTPSSTVTGEQAYTIASELIEDQVSTNFPDNDFPLLDFQYDDIKNNTYIIVSHFTYKNEYGVEQKYKYKAKVQYNGGKWANKNNWTLHYVEPYNN